MCWGGGVVQGLGQTDLVIKGLEVAHHGRSGDIHPGGGGGESSHKGRS